MSEAAALHGDRRGLVGARSDRPVLGGRDPWSRPPFLHVRDLVRARRRSAARWPRRRPPPRGPPDQLQVFAIFDDGQLWNRYWDGTSWHGWESLGGELTGTARGLVVGRRPDRRLGARPRRLDLAPLVGRHSLGRVGAPPGLASRVGGQPIVMATSSIEPLSQSPPSACAPTAIGWLFEIEPMVRVDCQAWPSTVSRTVVACFSHVIVW